MFAPGLIPSSRSFVTLRSLGTLGKPFAPGVAALAIVCGALSPTWGLPQLLAQPVSPDTASAKDQSDKLEWSGFRGGALSGVSDNDRLPLRWGLEENVAWKTPLPGFGCSSPIVWGDRVYLTTAVPEQAFDPPKVGLYFGGERPQPPQGVLQLQVLALELKTGKILWNTTAERYTPKSGVHIKNSHATPTPTTDGEHVWAWFGPGGLYCLNLKGEVIWSKQLGDLPSRLNWGIASSPLLYNGKLFVVCDFEGDSFLVALEAATGKEVWRKPRQETTNWSSPFLWKTATRTELIASGTHRVRSYQPDTGEVLWELAGHSSIYCPTPVANQELLFVSSGYVQDSVRPLFAIRPNAQGDLSLPEGTHQSTFVAWHLPQAGPYVPSPLLVGDYLYVLQDRGLLNCYEAATGKEHYVKQRLGRRDTAHYTVSPWSYRGKVFCLNEHGVTSVVPVGPEFRVEHVNNLDGICLASPALAGNSLLLRTDKTLYCFEER